MTKAKGIMQKQHWTWKEVRKAAIIFFLVLCVVSIPFYFIRDNGYNYVRISTKKKTVALETQDSIDTVFVGDSETWAAFGPLQIYHEHGFTSYNLATAGQWAGDSLVMINDVLKTQNPKVLVLGANTMYENVPDKLYALSEYLPLFFYHEFYFSTTLGKGKRDKNKGANLIKSVKPYEGSEDYMSRQTEAQAIGPNNLQMLQIIKQVCDENGILMIMVAAPSAKNWTEGKHLTIQQWCDENNVSFIDYNERDKQEEIAFDWSTDTRDQGDHLNVYGSIKISSNFGTYLKELGILVDHRNDSSYQEWEEDYESNQMYK
jgi:hypothetical protein